MPWKLCEWPRCTREGYLLGARGRHCRAHSMEVAAMNRAEYQKYRERAVQHGKTLVWRHRPISMATEKGSTKQADPAKVRKKS